ncbi:MAG TPA: 2-C-methyl-D-erythritol 4-phosphate cytidylyltransferase [Planctomycetota bacterium]|nr:2-C-methyl-D-erythritol 4-phosphate cytidylyltransferase [Planctomycetota bacterium]
MARRQPPTFFCSAVVVAAGSSSRMGGNVRKPYLELRKRPILAWTLSALSRVEGLREIVLVTRPDDRKTAAAAAKKARLPRSVKLRFADGGARRQDSVFNGLKATNAKAAVVMIHDAARPFPPLDAIHCGLAQAASIGASILAVRVKDTVKREASNPSPGRGPGAGDEHSMPTCRIETTVPRAGLWLAQTPQIFQRRLILELFERLFRERPGQEVTDDASICELFHQPVALVESSETNFKVTRPEDLAIAEAFLQAGIVGEKRSAKR